MPGTDTQAFDIEALLRFIRKAAEAREYDAGMGGRHDDGGASQIRDQAKYFEASLLFARNGGKAVHLPEEWKKYLLELDPEHAEYLRLKKKFEGR